MEKRDNWQTRHPSQRRETLVKDVNFKKAVTAGKNKYKAQAVAKETAILDCTYSVLVHDKNDIGGVYSIVRKLAGKKI